MDFPFNIHVFFRTIWISASEMAEAKNPVSAPMSAADDGEREMWGEGVSMCCLVNERQALKVTGCVLLLICQLANG